MEKNKYFVCLTGPPGFGSYKEAGRMLKRFTTFGSSLAIRDHTLLCFQLKLHEEGYRWQQPESALA